MVQILGPTLTQEKAPQQHRAEMKNIKHSKNMLKSHRRSDFEGGDAYRRGSEGEEWREGDSLDEKQGVSVLQKHMALFWQQQKKGR